jgi:hypothetical protein
MVQPRPDGNWEVMKPGADRASVVTNTQGDAINRGREMVRNDGGGELQIRGRDGQIRDSDTVPPGNESPRRDTR